MEEKTKTILGIIGGLTISGIGIYFLTNKQPKAELKSKEGGEGQPIPYQNLSAYEKGEPPNMKGYSTKGESTQQKRGVQQDYQPAPPPANVALEKLKYYNPQLGVIEEKELQPVTQQQVKQVFGASALEGRSNVNFYIDPISGMLYGKLSNPELTPSGEPQSSKESDKQTEVKKKSGILDYFVQGIKDLRNKISGTSNNPYISAGVYGTDIYLTSKTIKTVAASGKSATSVATGLTLGAVLSGAQTFSSLWEQQKAIEQKYADLSAKQKAIRERPVINGGSSEDARQRWAEFDALQKQKDELVRQSKALGSKGYSEIVGKSWTRAPWQVVGDVMNIGDLLFKTKFTENAESYIRKKAPALFDWFVGYKGQEVKT